MRSLTDLCWAERVIESDDADRARWITDELSERLGMLTICEQPCFAAVPHPTFFGPALQDVSSAAGSSDDYTLIWRSRHAPAFVTRSAATFTRILPPIIRRGPPEIGVFALCVDDRAEMVDGDLLTTLMSRHGSPPPLPVAGIFFDSGDAIKRL